MTDASILITTYNVERYVTRAIESALAQGDFEIIVVDDGSSDRTWEIIQSITDPRIRPFRLDSNAGPGAARNKGIAEAKGAWIAVLDGDDAFAPGRMERLLTRAKDSQADIVVDNLTVCREADGKEFLMFPQAAFAALTRMTLTLFIRGTLPGSGKYTLGYLKPMFSADFLRKHALKYDTQLRIGEDYLILAEALALGASCAIEPEAGYRYTVRAGSISHRLTLENLDRIRAGDAAFTARHALDAESAMEQRRRSKLHDEMRAYTLLVSAIKARSVKGALQALAPCPSAARHLWEPIWKRLSGAKL